MSSDPSREGVAGNDWRRRTRLGILKCSSKDCKNNLHSFRQRASKNVSYRRDSCVGCGFDDIDWGRLDLRNINDVDYTIKALNFEMIRNYYWGNQIEEGVIVKAGRIGLDGIRTRTTTRLERMLRPPKKLIFRDGMMTPWGGDIIHYAQHGTGTCCRACVEEWHDINRSSRLSQEELEYFADLIMTYTRKRVPSLELDGYAA